MSENVGTVTENTEQKPAKNGVGVSRRGLLQGAAFVSAVAATGATTTTAFAAGPGMVLAEDPLTRANAARQIKIDRADANFNATPFTVQPINADEAMYPDRRGNYSKGLQHDDIGEVIPASYNTFLNALDSRNPADFENILVGTPGGFGRLVSPQAAFAFEMSGRDGNASRIPAAPGFASNVTEAEMAELYWYSVTRDVPFIEYGSDPKIAMAAADLNNFTAKSILFPVDGSGNVTPATIFRGRIWQGGASGITPAGTGVGPYVSQFLLKPFAIGQLKVDQVYPGLKRKGENQFMTQFAEALSIQRGAAPNAATSFDANNRHFIKSMRDLSEWVHRDFPLQAGLHALSVIFGFGDDAAFDQSLPYFNGNSATQQGFVTFGLPDISHLTVHAPRQALTGAWFQKWSAHRRLRPEVYGMRLNVQNRGLKNYGIGGELLGSQAYAMAVDEVRKVNGARNDSSNDGLLPMGFPEGSPTHPAYPGGHSSFVAAGATVLKAFCNENYVIPNPVQADKNGNQLVPWTGAPLTLGGELNKLVVNVTHARDAAGMHWRSDGVGNLIGEAVAIALLADYTRTYNEIIGPLSLTKFDGTPVTIQNGVVTM